MAELHSNPFKVWGQLKLTYPHSHRVANKYLQITATSVPSERLFSKTGTIINDRRSRIKPERLKKMVFLGSLPIEEWL